MTDFIHIPENRVRQISVSVIVSEDGVPKEIVRRNLIAKVAHSIAERLVTFNKLIRTNKTSPFGTEWTLDLEVIVPKSCVTPAKSSRKENPMDELITKNVCAEVDVDRSIMLYHAEGEEPVIVLHHADALALRNWLTQWLNETGDPT